MSSKYNLAEVKLIGILEEVTKSHNKRKRSVNSDNSSSKEELLYLNK
ncbi:MAG TPA: hypothetical protein VJ729_04390 [Nitrososphaeraceae archaeon]|nr:hypothetical protein [Nitrososphaeraceae archaeon]